MYTCSSTQISASHMLATPWHGQDNVFKLIIKMENSMAVCVTWTDLSISETANLLRFSHSMVNGLKERNYAVSGNSLGESA